MAIEYLLLKNERSGTQSRFVRAYVRDTAVSPQVRLVEATIPIASTPASLNLQALFNAGTIVPNGAKLWRQTELAATGDVSREVVDAILEVVRANGTLAQMNAAGANALAADVRQTTAYNRIAAALNAATAAERWQFLALLATVAYSKIGQK